MIIDSHEVDTHCNGMCLSASDVGIPASGIAYAHPMCPAHGDPEHKFVPASTDGAGRLYCQCGAIQVEHPAQITTSLAALESAREALFGYHANARALATLAEVSQLINPQP